MLAYDLFHDPARRSYAAMPDADALVDRDALTEAGLVDVRLDALTGSLGLLIDMRGALSEGDGEVAVVIYRGVKSFTWREPSRRLPRVWQTVIESIPGNRDGIARLELFCIDDAYLAVEARAGEFYVGDMAGVHGAPPDFTEDDDVTIRAGMPNWMYTFQPLAATFLDPVGPLG